MASRKASDQVREWLTARGATRVDEALLGELNAAFPKLQSLRRALRECGVPLSPFVEGVRQDSLAELARTLIALQHAYQATADPRIRAMIIESITHAKFGVHKRPEKAEMIEWMLVWLHDPSLFETWVKLRRRSIGEGVAEQMTGPDTGETHEH